MLVRYYLGAYSFNLRGVWAADSMLTLCGLYNAIPGPVVVCCPKNIVGLNSLRIMADIKLFGGIEYGTRVAKLLLGVVVLRHLGAAIGSRNYLRKVIHVLAHTSRHENGRGVG